MHSSKISPVVGSIVFGNWILSNNEHFANAFDCIEVIVNGKRLSDSSYKDDRSDGAALEFIRTNSVRFKRNYLITTREENNSSAYDVYEVSQPPRRINDGLDNLYTSVITDMRKEIPGIKRGRYLSLDKLGIDGILTDEKIETLGVVVRNATNSEELNTMLSRAGISDLVDTLEFFKLFVEVPTIVTFLLIFKYER